MITLQQDDTQLRIFQAPLILYGIGALFTLPLICSTLAQFQNRTMTEEGGYCFIPLVLLIWYLLLDHIALRETIIVDRATQQLYRSVRGLFRHTEQHISLASIQRIVLEAKPDKYGTVYQYLYLEGPNERHQINNHYLVRNKHRKVATILHDFLAIPFED